MPDIKQAVEHEPQAENLGWEPRVGDVVRARGQSATLTVTRMWRATVAEPEPDVVTRMWRATVAEPEPEVEVFGAHCGVVLLPLDAVELVARAQFPPARPIDANTAALIQAGERREQAETCGKCGSPVKVNGEQRTCARCSASWRVRRQAAQSPWVPPAEESAPHLPEARDSEIAQLREELDSARRAEQRATREKREVEQRLRVSESRLTAAHSTIERLRGEFRARDEEIERLQTANALQATPERSAGVDSAFVRALQVLAEVADTYAPEDPARKVIQRLRDCLPLGPHRIEFGVKEVLP